MGECATQCEVDMKKATKHKICILCKQLYFDGGKPDWSERTPGYEWSAKCQKGYWSMSGRGISIEDYRDNLLKADSCKYYDEV